MKMKGSVTQLCERLPDGRSIGCKTVFKPHDAYYMPDASDYLSQIIFDDSQDFVEKVGEKVAERVWENDEIVEVVIDYKSDDVMILDPHGEHYSHWEKDSYLATYPYEHYVETLRPITRRRR